MANQVAVMIAAIMLVGFMMFAAGPVGAFVERHPTVKMLALSFPLLIGVTSSWKVGQHISKGYVYLPWHPVFVEMLNLRARKGRGAGPALHSGAGRPLAY
jgi:predicted tellurium resistance membrane protein TerC